MKKTVTKDDQKNLAITYTIGFGLSLLLTIVPYLLVVNERLSGNWLIAVVLGLAIVQLAIQLIYFLHLGSEKKPRWNLMVFGFMALIVLIVVIGSLWIMSNLNYNLHPIQAEKYIKKEEMIESP